LFGEQSAQLIIFTCYLVETVFGIVELIAQFSDLNDLNQSNFNDLVLHLVHSFLV
jgi:hypothetical protein